MLTTEQKAMQRIHQIAGSVEVFDKVVWNKKHTAFIGYKYFDDMYYIIKEYVYYNKKEKRIEIIRDFIEQ